MTSQRLDLETWEGAAQFRFFSGFERPHYAITSRIDMTHLMGRRKEIGLSPFRATIWAIGAGIHGVKELKTRFKGHEITQFDHVTLSSTIDTPDGDFRYGYFDWSEDFAAFDAATAQIIEDVRAGSALNPNDPDNLGIVFLSCLPWLDYTALDNALPHASDCIPRVSWGKIVDHGGRFDMAMSIQVHHAVVQGRQVGQFFKHVQDAVNAV